MVSASLSKTVAQSVHQANGWPLTRRWFSGTAKKSERTMTVWMRSAQSRARPWRSRKGCKASKDCCSICAAWAFTPPQWRKSWASAISSKAACQSAPSPSTSPLALQCAPSIATCTVIAVSTSAKCRRLWYGGSAVAIAPALSASMWIASSRAAASRHAVVGVWAPWLRCKKSAQSSNKQGNPTHWAAHDWRT